MHTKTFAGALLILTAAIAGCTPVSAVQQDTITVGLEVEQVTDEETETATEHVRSGTALDALNGLRIVAHDIQPYDRADQNHQRRGRCPE